jgi:hypothetical protein
VKISTTKFITRTAILLALTLVFQAIGRYIPLGPNSNFIVGPLVNACLLIATAFTGLWSGIIISVLAPFGAVLTGAAIPLLFTPFIAAGNAVLVIVFYILRKRRTVGIVSGAVLKFGVLFASISLFLGISEVAPKLASALYFSFSWPQLVTALIGGILAMIVINALEKTNKLI